MAPSSAVWALLLTGCASPGVPRSPSLHLPTPVRDLSAVRAGSSVQLRFTAPDETTDHQPLERRGVPVPVTAVVCRVQGAACLQVVRLAVKPGEAVTAADTLPPALTLGQGRRVAYRVRVENAAGRSAGDSRDALAAGGAAPAAITGLAATTVAQGIQLTWQAASDGQTPVRVEATTDQATLPEAHVAGGRTASRNGSTVRLLQVPRDAGGAVDTAPTVGARVTYRVYRQRGVKVDGEVLPLEGDAVTVTAVRSADVFAPAAPVGLLAVSFTAENAGSSVSLSWEPNGDRDVAGYVVYRAAQGEDWSRRTAEPVAGVSFEDRGVRAGSHLRYAVTAVDRAGNESPRSKVVEVDVH